MIERPAVERTALNILTYAVTSISKTCRVFYFAADPLAGFQFSMNTRRRKDRQIGGHLRPAILLQNAGKTFTGEHNMPPLTSLSTSFQKASKIWPQLHLSCISLPLWTGQKRANSCCSYRHSSLLNYCGHDCSRYRHIEGCNWPRRRELLDVSLLD